MSEKCPVEHKSRGIWANKVVSVGNTEVITKFINKENISNLTSAREISTIPRSSIQSNESKNWIYPSQQMFFNAMKRKNWNPNAADMQTIVTIHNAFNERAWYEIKEWEKDLGSEQCGGPKLVRFSGNAAKLSLKARILTLAGYAPPFDKHEWVIDRCGKDITYIIDFYSGKPSGKVGNISFYLDVRPKGVEGYRMRIVRCFNYLWGKF